MLLPLFALVAAGCTDDDPGAEDATGTVAASPQATATEDAATPTSTATATGTPSTDGASEGSGGFEDAVTRVVELARPSAVQVTTEQVVNNAGTETVVPSGVGSGVIIDDQGHVLTNDHVITGASNVIVSLTDGRQFDAEIVGQDPQTDLAVLRLLEIEGEDLPVAAIGSSGDLRVGSWVVAIGHALGLEGGPTVTTGVVSALGRTVQEPGVGGAPGPFLFDVIQTDAPINPGNSGGPLVNLQGEVIGINTLVAGSAGAGIPAQGIGFAIAIDTAIPLAEEMIETGRVVHPFVGINYVPLNSAVASQLGIQTTQGALIGGVQPGSPAEAAGLQADDVIVAIDGEPLVGESDLPEALDAREVDDQVEFEVRRGEETLTVEVTLGEAPPR
ncbi:MAG: trypsin-like peptidase domain-containing protein [Dehalococcoidia bacterium]